MARDYEARTKGSIGRLAVNSPEETIVVDGESKVILQDNASRNGLVITNASTDTIFLGLDRDARPFTGIPLRPWGSWDGMISGLLWDGFVTAVAQLDTEVPVCVVEV